jgi:hypothetical protein
VLPAPSTAGLPEALTHTNDRDLEHSAIATLLQREGSASGAAGSDRLAKTTAALSLPRHA